MITPISFGSTYKVATTSKERDLAAFYDFENLCDKLHSEKRGESKFEDKMEKKYPYNWSAVRTLVVPESCDNEVERYCANHGITFTKIFAHRLLEHDNIISRIKQPKQDKKLVFVNSQKLDELAKSQESNFEHIKSDYKKYYAPKTDLMIKSGDNFETSSLYLHPRSSSKETLIDYIDGFGAESINDESLFVDFNQESNNPDHCIYFALKDIGMKSIPVYVDDISYDIGNALGLFDK